MVFRHTIAAALNSIELFQPHRAMVKRSKRNTRRAKLKAFAYEVKIVSDIDYMLKLPNGETACLAYSEDQGPTLSLVMWPGENKTYIEVRNKRQFEHAEELR